MIETEHWGLIDYNEAWKRQAQYVREIQRGERLSTMVFCEHPSVITIGRGGLKENIITSQEELRSLGIQVVENNRGGDVTLHNPGQLIGYPIFNLSALREDLHWFLREIEICIIEAMSSFAIKAHQIEGLTGVWVGESRKICAIGINCSRWVTSHGFALNVANNLQEFERIIPCGIVDKAVTSMSVEVGRMITLAEVESVCRSIFGTRF